MGVITTLRQISMAMLLCVVLYGTIMVDRRFTMLLVPPFLVYYTTETPGWFYEIPIVHIISRSYTQSIEMFGEFTTKTMLALTGAYLGYVVSTNYM